MDTRMKTNSPIANISAIEEGNTSVHTNYQWLTFESDDDLNQEVSRRRLADHPKTSWRSMESRLYAWSHVHKMKEPEISRRLDLCPSDFAALRDVHGVGRLPWEKWERTPFLAPMAG